MIIIVGKIVFFILAALALDRVADNVKETNYGGYVLAQLFSIICMVVAFIEIIKEALV